MIFIKAHFGNWHSATEEQARQLVREQTKQRLLKDILFDLTVCEIEG